MPQDNKNLMEQILEIDGLRLGLKEIEETLLAIRSGSVDALVIRCAEGEQVRALQGADLPFRVLVDAMNEGAVLLDLQGKILYSNRRFAEMVGQEPENLTGQTVIPFLSRDGERLVAGGAGGEARGDLTLTPPGGTPVEVRISVSRFTVDNTTVLCLVASDLSEERKLRAMAASERRATFLARAGQMLVSSLDYEATVERVARTSVPLLGDWCWVHLRDNGDPIRKLAVVHHDPEREKTIKSLTDQFPPTAENMPLVFEVLGSGQPIFLPEVGPAFLSRFSATPKLLRAIEPLGLRSFMVLPLIAHGRILGTLSFGAEQPRKAFTGVDFDLARDLAALTALAVDNARLHRIARRTNEDLEHRVKERTGQLEVAIHELEGFTYTMAHDLRAPLRAMSGYAELLLTDHADLRRDPAVRDYLERIGAGAKQMDLLINDLLAFSRLSRIDMRLEALSLEDTIAEATARLKKDIDHAGAVVRVDPALPRVRADRTALCMVLVNLLSNAVKFARPGVRPEVRVAAERRQGAVRITVEDNGIGIDPVFHERIFGVFERLNPSEQYPGTGIGLAIVRRSMERMGGRYGVESQLGSGSRFWIEVPADRPEA